MGENRKAYLGYSDEDLIPLINRDDRHAYAVLLQRYSFKIIRMAFSVLKNEEEAKDVAQDVFMSLLISLQNWDDGKNTKFSTWIYRVTFNKSIDYKRKQKQTECADDMDLPSQEKDGYSRVLEHEMAVQMQGLLNKLPATQKMAISLYYYHEMDIPSISQKMHLSDQAVRSLLKRGKAILRDKVQYCDGISNGMEFEYV